MSTSQAVCNQLGAAMALVMVNVDIGYNSSLLIHPNMSTTQQALEAVGLRKSVKVTVGMNISA